MAGPVMFLGYAHLHMQGEGALSPFQWLSEREITYCIGSPDSGYKIIDHRQEINRMVMRAIENRGENWSPEMFCTPSNIEITTDEQGLTVLLQDAEQGTPEPLILWFGTMEGEELETNPVEWLQYKDIGENRAAFIGIVNPELPTLFRMPISEES